MPTQSNKPADVPFMPRGAVIRMVAASAFCAIALYLVVFWNPTVEIRDDSLSQQEAPLVSVPQLDSRILDKAKDDTREQRLFLEQEPLSHLLAQSLNVSPEAARALGLPKDMVPITALQTNMREWRGRWIYYRGKIEQLEGPKPGHPSPGYGIFEATLRLDDGSLVLFAFSQPPKEGVEVGGYARAEGYALKLRDVAHPIEMMKAPMLVGAQLRRDYANWAPVTALDPTALADVHDVDKSAGDVQSSDESWRSIDEDQTKALWHLGAYARDAAAMTKEQWRAVPPLNAQEIWESFKKDEVARGTPMRILGTLAALRTIAAEPNPAGIQEWTEAWIQVRDVGGKTIPVWLPQGQKAQLGSSLEVRAWYFRRYSYETRRGKQMWTPLFVAAALDPFVFDTGRGMREITVWAFGGSVLLIAAIWIGVRREKRRSEEQEEALIARRRERRNREAAAGASTQP
jgi:hypothetical protein